MREQIKNIYTILALLVQLILIILILSLIAAIIGTFLVKAYNNFFGASVNPNIGGIISMIIIYWKIIGYGLKSE